MSNFASKTLMLYMVKMSRKYFNKDWENGLEYILWHWIHYASRMSQSDKHKLYILHTRARGWFAILDPAKGQQFMKTDKWVKLFQDEFDGSVS
ncbi:MAG: hypothetical protein GXP16_01425 [Gammaproteobacteria bacterium]|nr:hypothetical protein [Gammaproteobacteria bacterium]